MAKTYPEAKGRATAPASPTAVAKSKVAPFVPAAKTPVAAPTAPVAETKAPRVKKADRPACAEVRKDMGNTDIIRRAREYDGRQGTLRHAIVVAIQESATVWDAVKKQVNGPGKHSELAYTIKRVDVGFALANGYITISPAK